ISNTEIALYTSWLYLPWVIKPLWSPLVDLLKTKRTWIIVTQFMIGAGLASVALTIPVHEFFQYTLAFFWLLAFSSATHDIAADGFYMLGLSTHNQALFVGIRTLFYRFAFLSGQGLLVILAGQLEESSGNISFAWMVTFFILAGLLVLFAIYHLIILPKPKSDEKRNQLQLKNLMFNSLKTFTAFFKKKNILLILLFILFYRFGEAQLVKLASPFLLDAKNLGGLELTTSEVGFVYGTVGIIALSLGGLLGGIAAARNGLKYWIWWMLFAINVPNLAYVYLAYSQTSDFVMINICVGVEQFGYGFGFTAFLLYLIYISEGEYKTSHYAIATGFMALGMMLPGMISGWIQEQVGYNYFFIWVCISTIPAFIITKFISIDENFGKKVTEGKS
ncbi:MAG TPA: MFS transporter, partial [Ignavibacteriaceae bacterium]|nr:MFS transporter [Ignavibacteriaceae bacterium]